MTSYLIGRLIPNRVHARWIITLHKYGYWALLLSWLPLVGDALAVGAGWLRLNPWLTPAAFAVGKFSRYVMVGGGWAWFESLVPCLETPLDRGGSGVGSGSYNPLRNRLNASAVRPRRQDANPGRMP